MRQVTVAATQFACSWDRAGNVDKAEALIRQAHAQGAQIILIQELFETPYFCQDQKPEYFELAAPAEGNPLLQRMCDLARELEVVLPLSFFEKANNAHYNSLATIDADGSILGIYRKSHIPDGPGYQEKYYFSPGDTGFQVHQTRYARIGTAICWDQWFPEAARVMALQGAELLFYPTAIGSEPQDASLDSRDHWQRVMQGHAGANLVPLIASNRIGREVFDTGSITFYGSSFIAGPKGEKLTEAGRDEEAVLTARFDLDEVARTRTGWGVFRDRRPSLYAPILSLDGSLRHG
ncbi:N-carbamoylputrescine amidase [Niveispirillum irakense]|uniref:N-carbamoylputrescine amidase n=1 Tax=Niveispirillum irakense TaxID=34011 RepID=UPI00041C51A4|nr:N-carbamoylputrescine amidase [Niveispirillum irakense]